MAAAHYQTAAFQSMSSALEDRELLKKNLFRPSVGFRKRRISMHVTYMTLTQSGIEVT